jgi:hypothetical protein
MFLVNHAIYVNDPYEKEEHLENDISNIKLELFGENRLYLRVKKLIGDKNRKQNIPDGYLIDLANGNNPKLFVVEVELAIHDPLNHIAVQLLEFSLSFDSSKQKVKEIIKNALKEDKEALSICEAYVKKCSYDSLDHLLERMIYKDKDAFNALVIIDEVDDFLERVLHEKFKFPIEVIAIERLINEQNEIAYNFEPFLQEYIIGGNTSKIVSETINTDSIDTVIVPAQEEGFNEVFIGENRWYAIRIHSSMIDKIKYIAAYQVAPVSGITYIAEVQNIEQWNDSNKYCLNFKGPAKKIPTISLIPKSIIKAPQGPRYAIYQKLISAKNMDEVF